MVQKLVNQNNAAQELLNPEQCSSIYKSEAVYGKIAESVRS